MRFLVGALNLGLRFLSVIFQTGLHKKSVFLYGDGWVCGPVGGLPEGPALPRAAQSTPRHPAPTPSTFTARRERRVAHSAASSKAGPAAQIFRKKRQDDLANRAEAPQKSPQPTQGPARPPACPPEVAMTSPGLAVRRTDIDGSILVRSIGRGSRAHTTFQRCRHHHPKTSPSLSPSPPCPGKPPRPSPSLCPQERARRPLGP